LLPGIAVPANPARAATPAQTQSDAHVIDRCNALPGRYTHQQSSLAAQAGGEHLASGARLKFESHVLILLCSASALPSIVAPLTFS
jgi:hypothetical protein